VIAIQTCRFKCRFIGFPRGTSGCRSVRPVSGTSPLYTGMQFTSSSAHSYLRGCVSRPAHVSVRRFPAPIVLLETCGRTGAAVGRPPCNRAHPTTAEGVGRPAHNNVGGMYRLPGFRLIGGLGIRLASRPCQHPDSVAGKPPEGSRPRSPPLRRLPPPGRHFYL